MSGISTVGGNSAALSLAELLSQQDQGQSSILDTSTTLASSNRMLNTASTKKAQAAYGGGGASSTVGQAALKKALAEMGASGKVTFKEIAAYQEELEAQFSVTMRLDLMERGVSAETPFTLTMTPQGMVQVECDDPVAKSRIEEYLDENPEMCEQFGYIQALANLDRARQSPIGSREAWEGVRNSKMEMQTQAVEMFFGEAADAGVNYASLMASFGSRMGLMNTEESAATFYAGLDFKV